MGELLWRALDVYFLFNMECNLNFYLESLEGGSNSDLKWMYRYFVSEEFMHIT